MIEPREMRALARHALLAGNPWQAAIGRPGTIPPAGARRARAACNG